ncbi:MAG: alanine--glyoxylate aminotransferase family protein, partial [Bacteroidetes bacterium]|nr:alanine--glyoxylate aminotransferase family protein [Bacteroidota bacterium]
FTPEVMQVFGAHTDSHVSVDFINSFGHSLELMREVWMCPSGQPFIVAGSGTLAMDMAGANLIEHGDKALVISTGYFGERYAELLKRYGADVKVLRAGIGKVVPHELIEKELAGNDYKLMTFTHVDTSTAVRVDPEPIGLLGKKYDVLTILDGVCSVAGEEIRQEEWGIDVVLTASQKAIGVPPGLALLVASQKAMEVWRKRKHPVGNYYADWMNWLPIMQAYEIRKPAYFGTPAVNLVAALEVSLMQILDEGLETRFRRHEKCGNAFRAAFSGLGMKQIPVRDDIAANTLSAPYYPDGIMGLQLIADMNKAGVIVAGGLHPDNRTEYFRIGHMGAIAPNDILATLGALEQSLWKGGYEFTCGAGLSAAQSELEF